MAKLVQKKATEGKNVKKQSSYKQFAEENAPKSPVLKNCVLAFLYGGTICLIGEFLATWLKNIGADKNWCTVILIGIGSLLTALGVYDKLAKHGGAGTLVPITGFANAIVSPAMEYKSEGMFAGLAAKMFTISGPVIVYGIAASFVCGLLSMAF